jgi:hypothetical protein
MKSKNMLLKGFFRNRNGSGAFSRGIAVFEMTVLTLTASTILIILAQGTLLFTQASEVKNLAHLGSSYAAANPAYDATTIKNFVLQNATGLVGANGGSALNITVSPATAPRNLGSPVTVTVAYTYPYSSSFGSSYWRCPEGC